MPLEFFFGCIFCIDLNGFPCAGFCLCEGPSTATENPLVLGHFAVQGEAGPLEVSENSFCSNQIEPGHTAGATGTVHYLYL